MAGGELLDKRVDWRAVTTQFLDELYEEIHRLRAEIEEQEDQIATLIHELGVARIKHNSPAVYRKVA